MFQLERSELSSLTVLHTSPAQAIRVKKQSRFRVVSIAVLSPRHPLGPTGVFESIRKPFWLLSERLF